MFRKFRRPESRTRVTRGAIARYDAKDADTGHSVYFAPAVGQARPDQIVQLRAWSKLFASIADDIESR